MTKALLSRMINIALDEYDHEAMTIICEKFLARKGFGIDEDAVAGFASVSRNPRQLISEVCETAMIFNNKQINEDIFKKVIGQLRLTSSGLTTTDTKMLNRLAEFPYVSERNMIAYLQIEKEEFQRMEAWLIKKDLMGISTHGRFISPKGLLEIGMKARKNDLDLVGEPIDE
jgi:Holliday junction resolvasome RuvABC ATP-dependent DNA helicase subunit